MKIFMMDPNCYKFTDDMIAHWEAQGHETYKELYYNPEKIRWADVVWFETCDNNLHQATMETMDGENADTTNLADKHVICRVIDIEVWSGCHNHVNWDYVDDTIFLAPHMKDLVEKDLPVPNPVVIPCGINMEKYPMRKNPENTKKIAWVAERWYAKGVDLFLQYAAKLYKVAPDYKIYAVGIWADSCAHGWYKAYIDQFIEENPMNVEFIDYVPNMDEFLEDKSHTICFSKKETFSYAIAEGMSKGLKPMVHNFYGAKDVWPKKYIFNTIDEAIDMTLGEYNPEEYREAVSKYDVKVMLESFDKIINKGKE